MGVINNNGSISLKFLVQGQLFKFTPLKGAKFGDRLMMARANSIMMQIEQDISLGEFDSTLAKYKTQNVIIPREVKPTNKTQHVTLLQIWQKYLDYKFNSWQESSKRSNSQMMAPYENLLATSMITDSTKVRDNLLSVTTTLNAKKLIANLSYACNHALEDGLIDHNPFAGMAGKIKISKANQKSDEDSINPFSKDERDEIINSFKYGSPSHKAYYPFIYFCFNCGCRPAEARALDWSNVDFDKGTITFNSGFVYGVEQIGTKTKASRTFRMNEGLLNFMTELKATVKGEIVFPSQKGDRISENSFFQVWGKKLKDLNIEYRSPYQMRHTFITLARLAGVDYPDIANMVGNSPEMILRHYQGATRNFVMPSL